MYIYIYIYRYIYIYIYITHYIIYSVFNLIQIHLKQKYKTYLFNKILNKYYIFMIRLINFY